MKKFKQYINFSGSTGDIMTINEIIDYHADDYTPHELDYFKQKLDNSSELYIDDYYYLIHYPIQTKIRKFFNRIINKIKI